MVGIQTSATLSVSLSGSEDDFVNLIVLRKSFFTSKGQDSSTFPLRWQNFR